MDVRQDGLPQSRAGSLHLLGGNTALNFANTESGRRSAHHLDHIRSSADMITWAAHAGVIDGSTAERARHAGPERQGALLHQARALRDVIFHINAAFAQHQAPQAHHVQSLARAHAASLQSATLAVNHGVYDWQWLAGAELSHEILGPIAQAATALLIAGDHGRVKQCPGEHCGWLFYDSSKNNSRQWCDMGVCGNRAKIKAYRKRHIQAGGMP